MKVIEIKASLERMFFIEARNKKVYKDGKATEELESTNVIAQTKAGEIQLVFPADTKKCEEFNEKFTFGDIIDLDSIADIRDIKVSIYRDNLSVKIMVDYKEDTDA